MTENKTIKMIDLQGEYQILQPELSPKINQVLSQANYIQGQEVKVFEQELAQYLNAKHVISCGNGTDALQIALMALNIGNGDEVIIPAFSYVAVIEVICLLGAQPILVDIDSGLFQLNNDLVEKAITSKTKAIIPVHLFGQSGDLDGLLTIAKKHQIAIIEDNAQALGAKYNQNRFLGTIGDIGCTSFFPTKNLSCFGDGGALFTNNDELATQIRMIANHGQSKKYHHEIIGINSRLDTLQAVVLSHKLKYLGANLQSKERIAKQYLNKLATVWNIELPVINKNAAHSWHQFTIKVKNGLRDNLKSYLIEYKIESMVYYPKSLNQQNAYKQFKSHTPISNDLCDSILSLPIHPLLGEADINYICKIIIQFFDAKN